MTTATFRRDPLFFSLADMPPTAVPQGLIRRVVGGPDAPFTAVPLGVRGVFTPGEAVWEYSDHGVIPWSFDERTRLIRLYPPPELLAQTWTAGGLLKSVRMLCHGGDIVLFPVGGIGVEVPAVDTPAVRAIIAAYLEETAVPLYIDGILRGALTLARRGWPPECAADYSVNLAAGAGFPVYRMHTVVAPVCFGRAHTRTARSVRAYVPVEAHILTEREVADDIDAAVRTYCDLLDTPPSPSRRSLLWDSFRRSICFPETP